MTLRLGAVAYDPKVVTIWNGFRDWFAANGFAFDYVLYSNYDTQVDDLLDGRIDVAWNSPLAWVRARRAAATRTIEGVEAVAMRDTDCDLTSVVVVLADSDVTTADGLHGRAVATGAWDSPQATVLPLAVLPDDVKVMGFDIGVGLHGDHIGGERDAARALADGTVDAACMIDGNHLAFTRDGTLPPGTRIVAQTQPYDHCNMTTGPAADAATTKHFTDLLLGMSYEDPAVRPLLDLEGLKQWRAGRTIGYDALEQAVDRTGFYDADGNPRPR